MRYNKKLVDRSLTKIQKAIETEYPNIKSLSYRSRIPEYIEARDIFYYISEKVGLTRTQIGGFIGKKHSTVTNNLSKIYGRMDVGDDIVPRLSERIIVEHDLTNLLKDDIKKDVTLSIKKELSRVNEELSDIKNKYTDLLFNINRADLRTLLEEMVDLPDDIVKDALAYVKARKVVFKGNQDKVKMYISNTEGIDPRQQWG